jgi:preprotein translocase subunit YajC
LTTYDAAVWLAETTEPGTASASGGGTNYMMFIFLAGIIAVMFFMSRRNKKQQQTQQNFRDNLEPGQRVMTAGGMVGVISEVEGDVVTIMSPAGDRSAYVRRAIRSVVPDDEWEAMLRPYAADEEEDDAAPDAPEEASDQAEEDLDEDPADSAEDKDQDKD